MTIRTSRELFPFDLDRLLESHVLTISLHLFSSVDDATTTSFITPQRGGLVIYNPPTSSQPASLENAFRTFSQQLRLLLGLPPLTSESLRIRTDRNAEIENLISIRLGESRHDTISTLSTLLKSIDPHTDDDEQVKNEVSVNEVVKNRVESALDLLDTVRDFSLLLRLSLVFY